MRTGERCGGTAQRTDARPVRHGQRLLHGNAIWIDSSNSVIPGEDKKAFLRTMARKNGEKRHSPEAKAHSRNLTPHTGALKQCGWSESKGYWSPPYSVGA